MSCIIKPVSNIPFGKSPLVCRLLKRVFSISLVLPKYVTTLDATKAFTFIKSKPTLINENSDLKTVPHKLAILFLLTTCKRYQNIKCFNLDYIKIFNDKVSCLCLKL